MGSFPPTYNGPCSEGRYLSSWSINFVAINKNLGKKTTTVVLDKDENFHCFPLK